MYNNLACLLDKFNGCVWREPITTRYSLKYAWNDVVVHYSVSTKHKQRPTEKSAFDQKLNCEIVTAISHKLILFSKNHKEKIVYKIKYDLKTFALKKTFLEFYPRVWASNQASFEFFLRWRVTKGNVMKPPLRRNSASLLWARRA